jgi:hypothetical protein
MCRWLQGTFHEFLRNFIAVEARIRLWEGLQALWEGRQALWEGSDVAGRGSVRCAVVIHLVACPNGVMLGRGSDLPNESNARGRLRHSHASEAIRTRD